MVPGCLVGLFLGGGAKVFPTVVAANQGGDASVTASKSVTLPSGIQAGDYILLCIGAYSDSGVNSNLPSGFTNLQDQARTRTHFRVCVKQAVGTESGTTVTVTGTKNFFIGWSVRIIRGANAYASTIAVANTETAPNCPSLTSGYGVDSVLWLACANQYDATASQGLPSGYSGLSQGAGSSGGWDWSRVSTAWKQVSAATEDPPAFANAISGGATGAGWEAVTVAFRPI